MLEVEYEQSSGARALSKGEIKSSSGESPSLCLFALEASGTAAHLPNSSEGSRTMRERRENCCSGELGQTREYKSDSNTEFGQTKLPPTQP